MPAKSRIDIKITAQKIREDMNARGVSGVELADRYKISQGQMSKILSGKLRTATPLFKKLCVEFNAIIEDRDLRVDLSRYPKIEKSLAELLDGTKRREHLVTQLLKSARNLADG